ncbi:peptide chain release factor N(5)-glutamine methyltransferase [Erythrobacteraceae bacterium CFH 75059]|uniref:peptide chain release factor N(5)-glutamine methyltransferase n=1 Tax=Qipengyuania thermophila TaxID=2509361 RepID=UPI00101F8813|nr:peptide chain release factor N(5)-glutamine methyltransferase [Qipengyuania thermophila]TCD06885.1 peptide chain release factor N(5)-glutamine methyltransferase [Erythrobacteraceae bacterium CFH 75059]
MSDRATGRTHGTSSIAAALRQGAEHLAATSPTGRLDAELLMAHALGVSRSDLLLRHTREAVPEGFAGLVARRARHEPVAYITGEQEFYGLAFAVTPDVLIPRGDSEVLVDAALALDPPPRRVLDLGTGSGALLLAVLAHVPHARGTGLDRSGAALAVARRNASALCLEERARFVAADWSCLGWSDTLGCHDLVLCNPPYVPTGAPLPADVRDFEPGGALFAGADGLDAYRLLVPQLDALVADGGAVLLETGDAQGGAVLALAESCGWRGEVRHDLGGRPRLVALRRAACP